MIAKSLIGSIAGNSLLAARLIVVVICSHAAVSSAQTLPSGVINAPPTLIGDNESIGSNTTLNVSDGGIVGDSFSAGLCCETNTDVVVNISGGLVGDHFGASSGSILNITGGSVGGVLVSGTANISGGVINGRVVAFNKGIVNVSGGSFNEANGVLDASQGGTLNISGGTIGNLFVMGNSGGFVDPPRVSISGGTFGRVRSSSRGDGARFDVSGGTFTGFIDIFANNTFSIFGADFNIDGHPLNLELGVPMVVSERNVVLNGRFADGSEFEFDLFDPLDDTRDFFSKDAIVTVTLVPEPTSIALAALMVSAATVLRR